MKSFPRKISLAAVLATVFFHTVAPALASGMLPETSVVIVNEADGEASINLKNADPSPALLYSSIQNIAEDTESLLVITPPVARVEPNETQLVRFILQEKEPLKVQRLKRVFFEGIPQKVAGNESGAKITMTVRQNLPVIINPKGLARNREPWTLLKWTLEGDKLMVANDSAYVVRLGQTVQLQPSGPTAELPRSYVLPGDKIAVTVDATKAKAMTSVKIAPATVYGYAVESYDAPLAASPN